jgi:UDP-glucose 4-epimerase
MRVLVTGGAGFVGGYVVASLVATGARVRVLDDFSTGSMDNLCHARALGLADADIRAVDIATFEGQQEIRDWRPSVVVHLAANAAFARSIRDPYLDARINILGTIGVLAAAASCGAEKVVLASSGGTVYGELPAGAARLAEDAPRTPVSPYGLSKLTADRYAELYRELFGLPHTALALANVYGPGQDPGAGVVAATARAVATGRRPLIYGDGLQTRDFVHVSDVADAFRRAVNAPPCATVNIGTGIETRIADVVAEVCRCFGVTTTPQYAPERPGEVTRICLDNRRAAELLGWRPTVGLVEGIAGVVDTLRAPEPAGA